MYSFLILLSLFDGLCSIFDTLNVVNFLGPSNAHRGEGFPVDSKFLMRFRWRFSSFLQSSDVIDG